LGGRSGHLATATIQLIGECVWGQNSKNRARRGKAVGPEKSIYQLLPFDPSFQPTKHNIYLIRWANTKNKLIVPERE
jgi:hypothetical protein